MNPAYIFTYHFSEIHFDIICPSASKLPLFLRSADQNSACIYNFTQACYNPSHLILFHFITLPHEDYKSQSSSLFNCLQSFVPSSPLGPNTFFSTLHSNILSQHCSFQTDNRFTPIQNRYGERETFCIFN